MTPNYHRSRRKTKSYRKDKVIHRRKKRTLFWILLSICLIISLVYGSYSLASNIASGDLEKDSIKSQDLSIHFLELGNKSSGDCTLIKVGNTEILIDAGSTSSSIPTIKNYLDQYIEDDLIEFVIVTHAHEDHYACFATSINKESLFDIYNVKTVIEFAQITEGKDETAMYLNYRRELNELQTRCGTEVFNAKECIDAENGAQKLYNLGNNIQLEILDQRFYHEASDNENNHSVCCQIIQNNEKYYLFTGDLEAEGEASLITLNNLHRVELYKAGHHGSNTSSSENFLSVIEPKNVGVTCCAGDKYNFPTQEFINRIAPHTKNVFVTTYIKSDGTFASLNGVIVVYCNNTDSVVTINCSNNTTLFKDSEWFKENRSTPVNWLYN